MNYKKMTAVLCASLLAISLPACGQNDSTATDNTTSSDSIASSTGITAGAAELVDTSDMFTDRDLSSGYDASEAAAITLSDSGSTSDSGQVSISGNTITISGEGVYILSGTLSDGQIIIDADGKKVQLVLDNASITNSSSAAIYVKAADKVFVTLADESSNTVATTGEFVAIDDNNIDAAIFSKSDLTLNGSGELTVSCAYGHGIVSKDDLSITGGTYDITAASHALSGKDSVRIADGTLTLTSGKDGIHSENTDNSDKGFIYIADGTITITSDGDGMDASSVVQIDNGTISITSGDDGVHSDTDLIINGGTISIAESYEGLEGVTITINDGDISLYASDDGLNAAGDYEDETTGNEAASDSSEYCEQNQIVINGGTLYVNASGDGIDSNGDLIINDGQISVDGPVSGSDAPLDCGGNIYVNGGTLIAVGSSSMAEAFSDECTQGAMLVTLDSMISGDVVLLDADGNTLFTYTPSKTYSCVMLSTSDITEGSTYTLNCADETTTVEMTSLVYGTGSQMGGFGGGSGDHQKPDDMTPPSDGQAPSDMTPPSDGQAPSDMTPPSDDSSTT